MAGSPLEGAVVGQSESGEESGPGGRRVCRDAVECRCDDSLCVVVAGLAFATTVCETERSPD